MNFKKFISGVSALTIAASAFAGMAVTANAATVTNTDGSSTSTFTADYSTYTAESDISDWTVSSGTLSVNAGTGLKLTGGNEGTAAYKTISSTEDVFSNTVTGTIKWNTGNSTGRAGGYNYLTLSDASGHEIFSVRSYGADTKASILTGDTETPEYTWTSGNTLYVRNANWDISFSLDTVTHTINSLSINPNVGNTRPSVTNKPFISSEASAVDKVTIGYSKPGRITSSDSTIKYIDVRADKPAPGEVVSVKVKYQLANGTEIQTDTLAITDCYTKANSAVAVTSAMEGDEVYIPFKEYILKNGTLYKTASTGNNPNFGNAVTLTSDTVLTKTVSEDSTAGTVVLFEDLDQTTGDSAAIRASNMSAYNNTGYTSANDLPAGVYTFIFRAMNKGRNSSVKVGDTTVAEIGDIANKNAWGTKTVSDVTISKAAKLSLAKGGSNTIDCYDIIIAIKTGDVPTAEATLVNGNVTDDEGYDEADKGAVYSVYEATVTAGTNAITNVQFTLNNGAMSTDTWSNGIMTSGNAVFALIVPMASTEVTDITAVIDNVPYVAFN
jgi:hypothetical protein